MNSTQLPGLEVGDSYLGPSVQQVSNKALANAITSVQKELRPAAQTPAFPQRHRFHANPWGAPRFGQFAFRN